MDFSQVLNVALSGALMWIFGTALQISKTLAVHEERHKRHDARFERIEERIG